MKSSPFFGPFVGVLLFVLSFSTQATAIPVGAGNQPGDYIFGAEYLNHWSLGAYQLDRDRDVVVGYNHGNKMESKKTMGYVGYEFIYGITAFITAGENDTRFNYEHPHSSARELGAGIQFNFLNHAIPDPTLLEDRITVNGHLQYTRSGGKSRCGIKYPKWDELSGDLTLSLINDIDGTKFYNPEGIGFYIGLGYSTLKSSSISERTSMGYVAGVNVFYSESVTFEVGFENIDHSSVLIGINVRL